jgi:short-subunit dehydrogenase
MGNLKGQHRVVFITGANSGIGLATAEQLASKGYKVYGVARREYQTKNFTCFVGDVNDSARMAEILTDIYKREGRLDAIVNNAGFGIAGAMECANKDSVNRLVQTNFVAVTDLCTKALPYLKQTALKNKDVRDRQTTKIINISSVGGIMPLPYQAIYSATKAAVEVFSRALDNEVLGYGVRVTAVLPGDTQTGFTSARVVEQSEELASNKAMHRSLARMEHDEQNGKSPQAVATVVYKALKKRTPPLRVSVGTISKLEVFLSRLLSVRTLNKILHKLYA